MDAEENCTVSDADISADTSKSKDISEEVKKNGITDGDRAKKWEFDKNLDDQLKNQPDILKYIKRLQKYIKKQDKKIKKLKRNIKKYKSKHTKDAYTETADFEDYVKGKETKSISEEIREAAENAMLQTGFVYEATSGMYYHCETGYYYNAELGLYYDGNSGTYLKYNEEKETYEYHSQTDVVLQDPPKPQTQKTKRKHRPEKVKYDSCSVDGLLRDFTKLSIDQSQKNALDISTSWPPCMRIIIKETQIEKLKVGSLYIITCDGGSIGREGDHSIVIPDINVSKYHAKISFNREKNKYVIVDVGSQNGTILNGTRISEPKQMSEPAKIVHGSILQFGTTKLLCHIHDGQKTCGHCEPGLIQIEEPKSEPTEKPMKKGAQHKMQLNRLRKKFGLDPHEITPELASGYSDRAEERRKHVGSLNENEKTQTASIHESIAPDNKGFKMLAKMGWTEGESLGKDGTGLKEPVPIVGNQGTTGLGTGDVGTIVHTVQRKINVWKKALQRFELVKDVKLEAFRESSDEDDSK